MSREQEFAVVLRREPEGGFTIRVPDLPEIVSFADDEAEALVMAREAIELALEYRQDTGMALPFPNTNPIRIIKVPMPEPA